MNADRASDLLTSDEAICHIVLAIDAIVPVLKRQQGDAAICALLRCKRTRQRLNLPEQRAVDRYRATLDHVRRAGHGDLICDQIEGYISALLVEPGFQSPAAESVLADIARPLSTSRTRSRGHRRADRLA